MSGFLPKVSPSKGTYSLHFPSGSNKSLEVTEQILIDNNAKHHIFFNDMGFHNHASHHVLSAFSLGASNERIKAIYDQEASNQRPIIPSRGDLTLENYTERLGDIAAYSDFHDLFKLQIQKYGAHATVRRWFFSGDFVQRVFGGVLHPIIHISYGIEYDMPGMVAEGLAMAACTGKYMITLTPTFGPLTSHAPVPVPVSSTIHSAQSTARNKIYQLTEHMVNSLGLGASPTETTRTVVPSHHSLAAIFEQIIKDPLFDGIIAMDGTDSLQAFIKVIDNEKTAAKIKDYANAWVIEQTPEGIQERAGELLTLCARLTGAVGLRGDKVKINFFLVHTLTSSYAVCHMISILSVAEATVILRTQLIAAMTFFITQGRPVFRDDLLYAYTSPNENPTASNPWYAAIDLAIGASEAHVVKAVRALAFGQLAYGSTVHPSFWIKTAQLVADQKGDWAFVPIGLDEAWE
ncbi:hypothetical protein BDF14DRAFT_1849374 [Spinellus fusiger]|nr:hypothetical protein BDF14DRAFT_1849374 [Spinellus fusiger]